MTQLNDAVCIRASPIDRRREHGRRVERVKPVDNESDVVVWSNWARVFSPVAAGWMMTNSQTTVGQRGALPESALIGYGEHRRGGKRGAVATSRPRQLRHGTYLQAIIMVK